MRSTVGWLYGDAWSEENSWRSRGRDKRITLTINLLNDLEYINNLSFFFHLDNYCFFFLSVWTTGLEWCLDNLPLLAETIYDINLCFYTLHNVLLHTLQFWTRLLRVEGVKNKKSWGGWLSCSNRQTETNHFKQHHLPLNKYWVYYSWSFSWSLLKVSQDFQMSGVPHYRNGSSSAFRKQNTAFH